MDKGNKQYFQEGEQVVVIEDNGDGTSTLKFYHPVDGVEYERVKALAQAQEANLNTSSEVAEGN